MSEKNRELNFKALRAFNIGGSDKVEIQAPKVVRLTNARGGLRQVSSDDVRSLAKSAAGALASLNLGNANAKA